MHNQLPKLDIEYVNHMGYYIPKSDVKDFDPETYFDGTNFDANGLCSDERCQKLQYCRLKAEEKRCEC